MIWFNQYNAAEEHGGYSQFKPQGLAVSAFALLEALSSYVRILAALLGALCGDAEALLSCSQLSPAPAYPPVEFRHRSATDMPIKSPAKL